MYIKVLTTQVQNSTGKIVAVEPSATINIDVGENYNRGKLLNLQNKLQEFLRTGLNECLEFETSTDNETENR